MLRDIQLLLEDSASITSLKAKQIHAMLMKVILASLVIILIMWAINSLGWKQFNIIFFLLGGLYILVQVTKPFTVAVAAGAGVVLAGLNDKDKSQGALTGLYALYKITIGALFGFWVLAGLLATWSFEERPASFFYVMAMVLTIAVTVEVYTLKGSKMSAKVIVTYAVLVILAALWQTITKEQREMVPTIPFTREAEKKEAAAVADAAMQRAVTEAQTKAAAEAAKRSTEQIVAKFPTEVVVPHCNDGWSEPLVMVSGWTVAWRWPGRVFGGAQFMKDGQWQDITAAFTPDADAFRFCGKSKDHLQLTGGKMPVTFTPK